MEPQEGDIAEDGAGNFVVYKYGRWHPADETGRPLGPIDASSRWGSGARELPNGSVERVGPRGVFRLSPTRLKVTKALEG